METETTSKENKPKRDKLFLYLFLLMAIACGILAWLYWGQKNETDTVVTENIQITAESEVVKKDLQQLQTEYDALQTNDAALKGEIEEKKALIEQLQKEVKAGKYDISKLKKETKTLREIMQHFVIEIDSLNTMNKHLIASNDSVTTELKSEKKKTSTLQTEKDKLYKIGSVIKASGMTVSAINVHGRNKEDETQKARKTDKIKIAFKLGENRITPKGKREIYVRIVTPDGKEWTESADADHMFTFNNSKGFYAAKKSIDYANDDMDVMIFVKKKDKENLLPGKYLVEINLDNATIGSTSLELE
ncbi:MAG: coiled-coil domain-containing protein [Bacteroidia bacterium]